MTTFENELIWSCPLSSHAQKVEDNSVTKFLEVIMLPGSTLSVSDDTKEFISLMWHLSFPPFVYQPGAILASGRSGRETTLWTAQN